jgi:hypothetical protein
MGFDVTYHPVTPEEMHSLYFTVREQSGAEDTLINRNHPKRRAAHDWGAVRTCNTSASLPSRHPAALGRWPGAGLGGSTPNDYAIPKGSCLT